MISFDRWLIQTVVYDNSYHIKDVLNLFIKEINIWINRNSEIEHDYEKETFQKKFYEMIFNEYYNDTNNTMEPYDSEMYEYFSLKFSQDISDLYLYFKDLAKVYNLDLFHNKGCNSLVLHDFLFNHLLIEDPYYDSDNESESDEENNINYNIDER